MQSQLQEQQKARTTNRQSINSGGPLDVEVAREKIAAKRKRESEEAIRRAEKAITEAVNKAKRSLNRRGIEARRLERERRQLIVELRARGEYIHMDLFDPIQDPEKDPTPEDLELLKPHPSLIQALENLCPLIDPQLYDSNSDVEIQLKRVEDVINIVEDEISNDNDDEIGRDYRSESEESHVSIDSIARNADFVALN